MKIFYDSNLISELSKTYLFLDHNIFVAAFNYKEQFGELFKLLKDSECAFTTIPSVFFEFTRGSDTLEKYNERAEFVKSLSSIYRIEQHLDHLEEIVVPLQKVTAVSTNFQIHFS